MKKVDENAQQIQPNGLAGGGVCVVYLLHKGLKLFILSIIHLSFMSGLFSTVAGFRDEFCSC